MRVRRRQRRALDIPVDEQGLEHRTPGAYARHNGEDFQLHDLRHGRGQHGVAVLAARMHELEHRLPQGLRMVDRCGGRQATPVVEPLGEFVGAVLRVLDGLQERIVGQLPPALQVGGQVGDRRIGPLGSEFIPDAIVLEVPQRLGLLPVRARRVPGNAFQLVHCSPPRLRAENCVPDREETEAKVPRRPKGLHRNQHRRPGRPGGRRRRAGGRRRGGRRVRW